MIWVEPCAGAAACALRLVGGPHCLPIVSYMGGKRRLAESILLAMGAMGRRPDQVLLADAGPWGWVWPTILHPETGPLVAARLRSWGAEDPRELWTRLSKEPPPEDQPSAAAQWLWLQARAASGVPVWWEGGRLLASDGRGVPRDAGQRRRPEEGWRSADHATGRTQPAAQTHAQDGAWMMGSGERRDPQGMTQRGVKPAKEKGVNREGGGGIVYTETLARRVEALVETVARWIVLQAGGALGKPVDLQGERWRTHGYGLLDDGTYTDPSRRRMMMLLPATRIDGLRRLPAVGWSVYHGDASDIVLPGDCADTYVYIDPPYANCTGYGWDLPREQVFALAHRWADAGAVVAVSEAVPLAEDLGPGWHAIDLTALGNGKPEWLTLSRPPVVRPAAQVTLW